MKASDNNAVINVIICMSHLLKSPLNEDLKL